MASRQTEFWGEVAKTQTLRDGGIRVTFDLPESAIVQMAELAAYQINGVVVDVTCIPRTLTDLDGETEKDAERSGPEVDSRRIAIRRDK